MSALYIFNDPSHTQPDPSNVQQLKSFCVASDDCGRDTLVDLGLYSTVEI